jgi:hypothetical protein
LIAVADDQGRLFGLPANVRSEIWPLDDIPLAEVEEDLNKLAELEMILLYEANGKEIIQIINWWRYQQKQWAGPSDYPPPPNWVDRTRYHGAEHKIIQENWDQPGGFIEEENQQPDSSETPGLPGDKPGDLPPDYQAENDVGLNDSDSDSEDEEEKLNGASADAEPPEPPDLPPEKPKKTKKGRKRDPLLDHPAIITYREEAHLHVPINWREEVCEIVDDAERWKKLVHEWIGHGWNKQNISGMLQAYQNGGIEKKKAEPAGFDAIRSYRQKQGLDNGER